MKPIWILLAALVSCSSKSKEGVTSKTVSATLNAAPHDWSVGGKTLKGGYFYGDASPGPVVRLAKGDTFKVRLTSQLDAVTNLHFHGFHVSPSDNSDNVFVELTKGQSFDYEVKVPTDHPAGLFWYHPHVHGTGDPQVHGGLAGLIVIEGDHDALPEVKGAREQVIGLQYVKTDENDVLTLSEKPKLGYQLANGSLNPTINASPGETQLFRIGNMSSDGWFDLAMDGIPMTLLAEDADPLPSAVTVDSFMLAPGKRIEFLATFPNAGRVVLRNKGFKWGFGTTPPADLVSVDVAGDTVASRQMPTKISDTLANSDLMNAVPAMKRTLKFDIDASGQPVKFTIDGKTFDHHRVDVVAKLGTVEEWRIENPSADDHPFHIHINDFVVTHTNDRPEAFPHFQDTAVIPRNGSITIRQKFADFSGMWVFHCHILGHEDAGMMGTIRVDP
jgi:suppressor of ftsI